MVRNAALLLTSAIAVALAASPAFAGNSDPDPTFNGTGIMYRELSSTLHYDIAGTCASQADGKLVMAGSTVLSNYNDRDFGTIRHNYDGTPDFTFGDGTGKVITNLNNYSDHEKGMVMLTNGRFVTVGYTQVAGAYTQFGLAKYTAAGALDTTFGAGTGKVTTTMGAFGGNPAAIAQQTDGKLIVVGGSSDTSTNTDFAIVRYLADGSLDTAFGVGGKRIVSISTGRDTATGVAIQDDGKIVVVGEYPSGTNSGLAVVRLNSNGAVDTTFGTSGTAQLAPTGLRVAGRAIAVQPDDKIVVGANSLIPANGSYMGLVARFTTTGALDTTFGGGAGYFQNGFGGSEVDITSMELLPTGQILLGGRSYISAQQTYLFLVARYTAAGALDTTYNGGAGWKLGDVASSSNVSMTSVSRFSVLPGGQFYACGYSGNRFAAVRYLGDALDTTPTAFNFAPVVGTAPSSLQLSNVVTISGLTPGAKVPAVVSGGTVSINGGAATSQLRYVQNGDQVFVSQTTSPTAGASKTTVLTIGGVHAANNKPYVIGTKVAAVFKTTNL